MTHLIETIRKMKNAAVLVIGDIMLDEFIYGDVNRVSPEGPVPILRIKKQTRMLGGAGNVVSNLRGLGVQTTLISVIGHDKAGENIKSIATSLGVNNCVLIEDETRPTIVKTRYIARSQQLLRTDFEETHVLPEPVQAILLENVAKIIGTVSAVVLSDYNKGVLSTSVIRSVIENANHARIPVLIDPKGRDYSIYRGAYVVTPNKKELSEATGDSSVQSDSDIENAALKIIKDAGIQAVVATRSEQGMSVINGRNTPLHLRTDAREVYDVSGAGDTVIATLAAALAAGASLEDAAILANRAGGIVVGKMGTAAIQSEELETAGSKDGEKSHVSWDQAREQIDRWKAQGLKIGFTNGCFDILHYGHVNYLKEARMRCDRLIVGLNSDASVRILKGHTRPINDQTARATVMAALQSVDMVVLFGAEKAGEDNTPAAVIDALRPDVFFKGGDYRIEQLPEAKVVLSYGGEVEIMPVYEGYSTTNIINKSSSAKVS